jgi:iron-sulfur cluster insertion protein
MNDLSTDFAPNLSGPAEISPMLAVTPAAIAKITAERTKRNQPDLLFRVTVSGGGCSGLQYQLGYNDQLLAEDDVTFPTDTPAVVSDTMSLRFLKGSVLDYEKDLMGARFAIKNPNAVSGCGCGVSFAVDFNKVQEIT